MDGPIVDSTCALLSQNKDAILNGLGITLKHESGATYRFDWVGLSEDLSEVQNVMGRTISIKKTSLPLVLKVLHTGVAQVFVRFHHRQFKVDTKHPFADAVERFNVLIKAERVKTEEHVNDLFSEPEFSRIVRLFDSQFIWVAGRYTAVFDIRSPSKIQYRQHPYDFTLSQDDVDTLRGNLDVIRQDLLQMMKTRIIPPVQRAEPMYTWRQVELTGAQNPMVVGVST